MVDHRSGRPRRGRGDGTLAQRGPNKWYLRVYVGLSDDGKPVQASRTVTAPNKTEALKELRKFVREVEAGQVKKPTSRTVGFLLHEWLNHLERIGRTPATIESYRLIAESHLIPALGDMPLHKVDGHVLDSYYAAKGGEGGGARFGKPLGPNTIRTHHATLSSAFTQAVKWGWIPANPCMQATPPSKQKTDRDAPPLELIWALREACDTPDLETAIILGAITGCRRGELCGLRWSDVDWEKRQLRVVRQRQPGPGGDRTVPPKTKRPPLSLDEGAMTMLREYRQKAEERADALGVLIPVDGWLLSLDAGRSPIPSKTLGEWIRNLSKRVGQPITTHLLRYFAATQLVALGTDPRTAAGRLGHSPEVLLRVYAGFLPERDRVAARGLEALVLGEKEKEE